MPSAPWLRPRAGSRFRWRPIFCELKPRPSQRSPSLVLHGPPDRERARRIEWKKAMGYLAGYAAEILLLLFLAAIQWRLGRMACGYAERRWPAGTLRTVRILTKVFVGAVLLGLCMNLPYARLLMLPARLAGWLRGCALMWALSSTGAWVIYELLAFFRVWSNDFSPGRRRLLRAAGSAAVAAPVAFLGFGALVERTAFRVREI